MSSRAEVAVGMSSCGIAAGARVVFEQLSQGRGGREPAVVRCFHGMHRRLPR